MRYTCLANITKILHKIIINFMVFNQLNKHFEFSHLRRLTILYPNNYLRLRTLCNWNRCVEVYKLSKVELDFALVFDVDRCLCPHKRSDGICSKYEFVIDFNSCNIHRRKRPLFSGGFPIVIALSTSRRPAYYAILSCM